MLSEKQKKIASKAGDPNKIDAKDFAVLKAEKAKGRGMGLEDEKLKPGKEYVEKAKGGMTKGQKKVGKVMKEFKEGKLKSSSGKKVTNPKQAIAIGLSEAGMSKPKKVVKAEEGKMITEVEAPDLGGMMGDIRESVNPYLRKPITPKERRERDIATRAIRAEVDTAVKTLARPKKKMGGGMMMQDSMGYKRGGSVRGGRAEMKGLRPAKLF